MDLQRAVDALPSGGIVRLPPGRITLEATVILTSNISLIGAGTSATTLVLAPGSGCHFFTNADHNLGNESIELREFSLDGDMAKQEKPANVTALSYACGGYFKRVRGITIEDIDARRIRQTAFHFNHSTGVRLTRVHATELGWSGVSTSGTDDIVLRRVAVSTAGLDIRHSGIHLDGGIGAYVDARVDGCTGNGIMLDSKFAPLSDVVVNGVGRRSMRGLSMSGAHEHQLSNVHVSGDYSNNEECGILVSNASNVFIVGAVIASNGKHGVALQGRSGVSHCVIADCRIADNPIAVAEFGADATSYQTGNSATGPADTEPPAPMVDARVTPPRSLQQRLRRRVTLKVRRFLGSVRRRYQARGEAEPPLSASPTRPGSLPPTVTAKPSAPPPPVQVAPEAHERSFEGVCRVCGELGVFMMNNPSLREGFRCPTCRAHLRYQGQADALVRRYAGQGASSLAELAKEAEFRRLHIYEPGVLGAFRPFLRQLPNYAVSDYWPDVAPGDERDAVRCENIMALTFPSESFDLVITSDIFEHVRHPQVGFSEVHRVLRAGGAHVFSIPVQHPMRATTIERVDTSGEEDVYLLEPRYHLGPNNSQHIVYNDFGRDLIDCLDEVGFDTEIIRFESVDPEASRLLTFCSVRR